jgi:hypothetical protein
MFVEPTINDFLDNIRWHLKKAANNAGVAVNAVQAQLAATHALQSGRAIILIFDAVRKEFHAGIDAALGELKRTILTDKARPCGVAASYNTMPAEFCS